MKNPGIALNIELLYNISMTTRKTHEPEIHPDLLRTMQAVYDQYTGQQVADVIAYIRQSIENEREQLFLEQEIERLTLKLKEMSK